MPELQAVIDFSIQINKFINIDLFQRGFYQIRLSLKLPNCKFSNKIELNRVNLKSLGLKNNFSNGDSEQLKEPNIVLPSGVINGMAVSKTFQINYKNEEITLNDTISYRMNICLDIQNCAKQIQKTNILLEVELWYSGQEFLLNQYDSILCVSSRQLKIHLDLCRGIHYYLPVIFDYFHLSAVTITIHGCLITLCQPYICKNNETSTLWLSSFIKNDLKNEKKNIKEDKQNNSYLLQLWRLQLVQWKLVSIILLSFFNLKKLIDEYYRVLPPWQQAQINYETLFVEVSLNNLSDSSKECFKEIKNNLNDDIIENNFDQLSSSIITKFQENTFQTYLQDNESLCLNVNSKKLEDALNIIEHDVAHICGLTIEQWQRFLILTTGSDQINQHLAKIHHFQRIKRFSEAFFCIEQPRSNLNSLCDQNSSLFLELSDFLRKSSYFINLPPCDVECIHLDGDCNTLPIIFEEKYEPSTIEKQLKSDSNIRYLDRKTHFVVNSPSKLSLSSSSTSSSNSPKSNMRFFFSRFNSEKTIRNRETSPTQIQKFKNYHNAEILELFELYKTEIFNEKISTDIDQMNRKIKLLNAFINKKNMIKNYSQLSLNFSNEKIKKSIKNLHPLNTDQNDDSNNKDSHSWPNLSAEIIINDEISFHKQLESFKKISSKVKQNKIKSRYHSVQNDYLKDSKFLLDLLPIINYHNFSGTMYFPKPPKEFAMEEIDEPAQEICMKPIPITVTDEKISDKKYPDILVEEISNSSELSFENKNSNNQINNSHSFQDLTKIKMDNKKKLTTKNSKDDIYLKPNNLNDAKFTFMELLQSDHCLICCRSIEKRSDDSSWPCKCMNICKNSKTPQLTPPSVRRISNFDSGFISFLHQKEAFRNTVTEKVKNLLFYSDFHTLASRIPYFQCESDFKAFKDLHLIVCVHGLDGNSADLRLVKTYLEIGLPTNNFEFLMSQRNQGETFDSLETLTDRLINEIENYVSTYKLNPSKISFIGHSLGNIIIRAATSRQDFMKRWRDKLHTFLSLSGPHLGLAYNRSGLVNMGLWFIQKFKRAPSLNQLSMKDSSDIKQTFLYRLSMKPGLEHFRNILLCGSSQDYYVPIHSAHIELCNAAINDSSEYGVAYREMTQNILKRLMSRTEINIVRYDVHHALNSNTNTLIGRAAHIAVLDSELFIEKFMMVVGLKYFV